MLRCGDNFPNFPVRRGVRDALNLTARGALIPVGSAALWILWNCRGCNCVIVLLMLTLFLWLWLEARGFFIDYAAGFRLRHSGS